MYPLRKITPARYLSPVQGLQPTKPPKTDPPASKKAAQPSPSWSFGCPARCPACCPLSQAAEPLTTGHQLCYPLSTVHCPPPPSPPPQIVQLSVYLPQPEFPHPQSNLNINPLPQNASLISSLIFFPSSSRSPISFSTTSSVCSFRPPSTAFFSPTVRPPNARRRVPENSTLCLSSLAVLLPRSSPLHPPKLRDTNRPPP